MIINDREKYDEIKSTISMKNIRKLLNNKEYSVAKVATSIGVSVSSLNGYISGERLPSITNLVALADYFNCNTDFLLGRTNNPEDVDGLYQTSVNPNIDVIMFKIRDLPQHKIELVAAYVQGLSDSER